ncbi:MAG: transposase [Deltaproteobacteria bacterium]|nr:transposase [Deltaproteobacteria bacterium]
MLDESDPRRHFALGRHKRFGSLLQLNPHPHSWLPDGVFVETGEGALCFVRLPEPNEDDVEKLCAQIRKRVLRLCDTPTTERRSSDFCVMGRWRRDRGSDPQ